jgi:stage V sporulation protein G
MKIVRMNPIPQDGNGKLKAFFDIETDDGIVIKGFRLINGTNGMFISSPDAKGKDGKYYETVIIPKKMKDNLQKQALEDFKNQ